MYDAAIGRFFTQDAFAEKYYPLNPYQYAANNPINLVDINGDSIWFTQNEGVWTLHMTGKVLNNSSGEAPTAEDFMRKMNSSFANSGIETDIQFSDVSSMDDVEESDHLIVVVDDVSDGNGESVRGGKVAYVEGSGFNRDNDDVVNTMVHESGHMLGLPHNFKEQKNMMNYPEMFFSDKRKYFNKSQANDIRQKYWDKGKLNYGKNYKISSEDVPQYVPNWLYRLYHSSSPSEPWKGPIKAGQKIPNPND
jgi:hypothetical protein